MELISTVQITIHVSNNTKRKAFSTEIEMFSIVGHSDIRKVFTLWESKFHNLVLDMYVILICLFIL